MPEKHPNISFKDKSADHPRASAPVGGFLGWLAGKRGYAHRKSTVSSRAKDNSDRRQEPSSIAKGKQPVRSAEEHQAEKQEREGQGGHRVYAQIPANAPTSSAVRRTHAGPSNVYERKFLSSIASTRQATGSSARTGSYEPRMSGALQAQDQPSSVGSDNSGNSGFSATSSTAAVCGSKVTDRAQTTSPGIKESGDERGFSATFSSGDTCKSSLEAQVQICPVPNESGYESGFSAGFSTDSVWGSKVADRDELGHDVGSSCHDEVSDQDSDREDADPDSMLSSDVSGGVPVYASTTNADRPPHDHNINAALNNLKIKDDCCLICHKRMHKDGFSCPGGCGTLYHDNCVSDWRTPRSSENQEPCPCPTCWQDIFQEDCAVCGKPIEDYEVCCPQQCGAWLHEPCVERWVNQCRETYADQNMPCPRCSAPWPNHIDEEAECPICFLAMDESLQDVTPCPALCRQNYHSECINAWLDSAEPNGRPRACPKCRAPWAPLFGH
ncbi:hypothetical protein ASPACDRAFT_64481 [Aspergillus aculeatus ATCC 16872]|uniref:RING-type domain-containing protein n=1 Tax=Aspergillus aculeatus (strain ATCC 16872 / CBS 172.66 / WB 5094) TaxID=690307 RepID=A0A1L9WGA0_ASPA1|nr:uncharacterized protein ASPACDRAFT_64481 [Aspergillus aculeatus ATCC 16872]OJJ95196.1 hypothetical protein ASPACDRAFT_64481 [Aspergillus aculeatus ATCC 16872]